MRSDAKRLPSTWVGVTSCLLLLTVGFVLTARAEQAKTSKDGVYSAAQAGKGKATYDEQCSACHGADMSGGGAPALAGADFLGFWDKTPVADLVEKIQTSMPANSPGSLSREKSTEIVAYMLQFNKFPAGEADLASDAAALKAINIAK